MAQDELEMAQIDPAWLQTLVAELRNCAYFDHVDDLSRWGWFADEILVNFFRRVLWWRLTFLEAKRMLDLYKKYSESHTPENRANYECSLLVLHDVSIEHLVQSIMLLDHRYDSSAYFSPLVDIDNQ